MLSRVAAPASPVVRLDELKAHLRVVGREEDELISDLERAAVSLLDGWGGLLGRGILRQAWRQEFSHWGRLRLALPDALSATVTWLDGDGAEQSADQAELRADHLGSYVLASGPASSRIFVVFEVELPAHHLMAVRQAVKLLVGQWYENREAGVTGTITATVPLAFESLINNVRVRRI
ncbi:head-tail connector protein [Pikeienuella sp. HZG-20]|uniref:head-tail connector protein n=1 Tax=Paludibacillus litoralis TaxID=3133267 RepID=UPI0030EBBA68